MLLNVQIEIPESEELSEYIEHHTYDDFGNGYLENTFSFEKYFKENIVGEMTKYAQKIIAENLGVRLQKEYETLACDDKYDFKKVVEENIKKKLEEEFQANAYDQLQIDLNKVKEQLEHNLYEFEYELRSKYDEITESLDEDYENLYEVVHGKEKNQQRLKENEIAKRLAKLEALENAGVDNCEGYEYALENL